DAAKRVGDIFSGGLGIGAVDGFKKGGAFADGSGREEAQGAADDAGFVADDVAEHIFRQDHVELFWVEDDLHGGVVHEKEIYPYVGVLGGDVLDDLAPEAGGF